MATFTASKALIGVPRLDGAKIAVVVENKFIPEEIAAYLQAFPLLGATVEPLSRIYWGDYKPTSAKFSSDNDPNDDPLWQTPDSIVVEKDVSTVSPSDYSAVIMAANYTSVRLRYPGDLPSNTANFDARAHVQSAPLVRFFAQAMLNRHIIKGALCHGLWMLTPHPELLKGRKVICHSVVMADILNAGAEICLTPNRVMVDGDLITGFSKHEVLPFIAAIATAIVNQ